MQKLFYPFLFLFLFPFVSFGACSASEAPLFNIPEETLSAVQSQPDGDRYFCWEIAYLVQSGQTSLPWQDYRRALTSHVDQLFPGHGKSPSELRAYGTPYDFEKLLILKQQYAIDSNDIEDIWAQTTPKVLEFYPFVYHHATSTIANQNTLSFAQSTCFSASDYATLAAPFPTLSKPMMWNSATGKFLNIFGTPLATIDDTISETKSILLIGSHRTEIPWDSETCRTLSVENTWAKSFTDIAHVLFFALFDNAGAFLNRTFEDFAALGRALLGIFLTFWIVFRIFINIWSLKDPIKPQDFFRDFWKLIVFASLYLIVLVGFTPRELVDTLLVPVLDVGAYYGRLVFESAFGNPLPPPDPTSFLGHVGTDSVIYGLVSPLYAFVSAFNETSLLPFSIAEGLISYGWNSFSLSTIFVGLGIFFVFGWAWVKLFVILLECILDLVLVLMLYPFLALAYVFPQTRHIGQHGINLVKTVATTLIFYPLLIVFNARMMMAFLTRSDPQTNQTVDMLLKAGDIEGLVRAFDLSFSMAVEGIFVGLMMVYVIKNGAGMIKEFSNSVNLQNKNEIDSAIKEYQGNWKKLKGWWNKDVMPKKGSDKGGDS